MDSYMKRTLEEWKELLIGNTYNWLTVIDVYKDDLRGYIAKCKCKCGKEYTAAARKIFAGKIKSCGCYKKSEEFSKLQSERIGRPEVSSKISSVVSKWYEENPELVAKRGESYSKWCKEHPDEVAENGRKRSKWCKEHPDEVAEWGRKRSERCKNDPILHKKLSDNKKKWHKEHPEAGAEFAANQAKWRKDHPNEAKLIHKKISKWYEDNPDKVKEKCDRWAVTYNNNLDANVESLLNSRTNYRADAVKDLDLHDFVHVDDIDLIKSGTSSHTKARTKCPMCGNYEYHMIYGFINYRDRCICNKPLCRKCAKSYTTSKYETEISEFISTFYSEEPIRNNRSILNGKELDLYYPEKKIAIEFNGNYWHQESRSGKEYHLNKYLKCVNSGIVLVSIFEYEWNLIRDKIELYLKDLFNDKVNCLSFVCKNTLNNNYPVPMMVFDSYTVESISETFYTTNSGYKVYTCGNSHIQLN